MNKEMAEVLVRVGPQAPMGRLMRRYWVPILSSWEIPEPDCPQVRVKILGEKLLAFRDSQGRAGLIDEFCAHRGASLFFGRNEECGIRCSYHGWKFDLNGQCVELPSVPELAPKMRITAYPCIERGGLVWAYMGPEGRQPPPPGLEWCEVPASHRFVSKRLQESSWLQAMEGGIDTTHASWVHRYELDRDPMHQAMANKYIKADRNAVFDVEEMPHGLSIFGRRNGEPASYYWRVTQFLFPWYTLIPPFGPHPLGGHVWVPIDDEHCWAWSINFHPDKPLSAGERRDLEEGKGIHVKYEKPGSFRPAANMDNDYLIDRAAQKDRRSFSGVSGFSVQDASLQESMGAIQDHSREHLVTTDKPIAMARRMLFNSALNLAQGIEPPALDAAVQRVRAASILLERSASVTDWAKDALYVKLGDKLSQPVYSL